MKEAELLHFGEVVNANRILSFSLYKMDQKETRRKKYNTTATGGVLISF